MIRLIYHQDATDVSSVTDKWLPNGWFELSEIAQNQLRCWVLLVWSPFGQCMHTFSTQRHDLGYEQCNEYLPHVSQSFSLFYQCMHIFCKATFNAVCIILLSVYLPTHPSFGVYNCLVFTWPCSLGLGYSNIFGVKCSRLKWSCLVLVSVTSSLPLTHI